MTISSYSEDEAWNFYACKTIYEEIKKDKKHRYVVFFILDEKQIDVETIGERNAEYDQFLKDLQKGGTGECRYGIYDFEYTHQCEGSSGANKKQKLLLMSWCPDTAMVKKKMKTLAPSTRCKTRCSVYRSASKQLTSLRPRRKPLKRNSTPPTANKSSIYLTLPPSCGRDPRETHDSRETRDLSDMYDQSVINVVCGIVYQNCDQNM
ncbi:unnamed protein product [Parnassius apollo]|uniref:(apollo) hypothetical protein n=1 Tax=Parnassius apollo TaxID=110799 RepID=A0A8S3XT69_PARAO|nr:unnamed protein product [Parnassius apollo]